ncbi:hypothetical protein BURKHO8Y_110047 [Burkholderia sp. 8Y]|nr:hypothetical protein BURKHO8Y_110047 [Burkholderia sp. 8Y]
MKRQQRARHSTRFVSLPEIIGSGKASGAPSRHSKLMDHTDFNSPKSGAHLQSLSFQTSSHKTGVW